MVVSTLEWPRYSLFQDLPDIDAVQQQVRGKGMAQGLHRGMLVESGTLLGRLNRPLQRETADMITPYHPVCRIYGQRIGGKQPLPGPFTRGAGIFAGK